MLPAQGAGKGGQVQRSFGTGAGKGGQDPSQGLIDRLRGQMDDVLRYRDEAEASRRRAHETQTRRLGEVDKLFEGREPFYDQVFQNVFRSGERAATEWDRGQRRDNRFSLLGRGLTGGSADVETQSRQRRRLSDVMGGVGARARGARTAARQGDMALRDRMRQGILSGMPWQGAQAYRPLLMQTPDFQGANRGHWQSLFESMGRGGLFS